MKKNILKDDYGKSLEVDLKEFLDHLNEYHKNGTSLHTQGGCSFTAVSYTHLTLPTNREV